MLVRCFLLSTLQGEVEAWLSLVLSGLVVFIQPAHILVKNKTKQKLHKHLPQTPPEIILIRGCHLFPQGHWPAVSLLKKQSAFRSRRETFHWKLNLRAIDPSVGNASLPVSYLVWFQFSSVQLLSPVRLFVTPWTTARRASLSITSFRNLIKLMSIESVMPSNRWRSDSFEKTLMLGKTEGRRRWGWQKLRWSGL